MIVNQKAYISNHPVTFGFGENLGKEDNVNPFPLPSSASSAAPSSKLKPPNTQQDIIHNSSWTSSIQCTVYALIAMRIKRIEFHSNLWWKIIFPLQPLEVCKWRTNQCKCKWSQDQQMVVTPSTTAMDICNVLFFFSQNIVCRKYFCFKDGFINMFGSTYI